MLFHWVLVKAASPPAAWIRLDLSALEVAKHEIHESTWTMSCSLHQNTGSLAVLLALYRTTYTVKMKQLMQGSGQGQEVVPSRFQVHWQTSTNPVDPSVNTWACLQILFRPHSVLRSHSMPSWPSPQHSNMNHVDRHAAVNHLELNSRTSLDSEGSL